MAWLFYYNAGGMFDIRLAYTLYTWSTHPGNLIACLAIILVLSVWIFRNWRLKPLAMRQAMWILPPMALLWLFFGMPYEPRVFLELWSVVFLLLLPVNVWHPALNQAKVSYKIIESAEVS